MATPPTYGAPYSKLICIRFEAKLSEYGSYLHVLVYFDLMQNKYRVSQK